MQLDCLMISRAVSPQCQHVTNVQTDGQECYNSIALCVAALCRNAIRSGNISETVQGRDVVTY